VKRPCISCGDLIGSGSRCKDCRPKSTGVRSHPYLHTARWEKLSKRLRKASPFCEHCGATESLQLGHIIPASEREDLIYAIENLRVECGTHNRMRSDSCTDDEREMVEARIKARKSHTQRALPIAENSA
jgi:5-methylcytosine-specific restriction endonuclease McrA